MRVLLQSTASGILIGGVYALVGIGLTIIYGVMRVINFAHGELLMIGMYLTWIIFTSFGVDPFLSIAITIPAMFLFGAFLQRVLINRVLNALPQNQILLTIGLGLVLSNVVMLIFTSDYKIITTRYSSSTINLAISWRNVNGDSDQRRWARATTERCKPSGPPISNVSRRLPERSTPARRSAT